jgi:excisionase family DNA binding protein
MAEGEPVHDVVTNRQGADLTPGARSLEEGTSAAVSKIMASDDSWTAMSDSEQIGARSIEPLLSISETAAVLGVSPVTVRRYIKAGEIACIKLSGRGGRRLIEPAAVREFLASRRQPRREPMRAAS